MDLISTLNGEYLREIKLKFIQTECFDAHWKIRGNKKAYTRIHSPQRAMYSQKLYWNKLLFKSCIKGQPVFVL